MKSATKDNDAARWARAIFAEILGVDDVGPHDDFFELGGNSLQAGRVVARIRRETGVRIRLADFIQNPTPMLAVNAVGMTRSDP